MVQIFAITAFVNSRPNQPTKDDGSPVKLKPKSQCDNIAPLRPFETECREITDNRIQSDGKTMANFKIDGKEKRLEVLEPTKNKYITVLLLGLDWMKKPGITLDTGRTQPKTNHV